MARILVISPMPSHPPNTGARMRLQTFLEQLSRDGHAIDFAHILKWSDEDNQMEGVWERYWAIPYKMPHKAHGSIMFAKLCQKFLGRALYYRMNVDDWYDSGVDQELAKIASAHQYDIVLVQYVFFSRAFRHFPNCVKVLDTHDLFGERHKRLERKNVISYFFYTSSSEEARGASRADVVIAIQPDEQKALQSLIGSDVKTIGHMTPHLPAPVKTPEPGPARVLFVGSNYDANIFAVRYFAQAILPLIKLDVPEIEFLVSGSVCHALEESPAYSLQGTFNEPAEIYANCEVVVNPIRYGSGLKIKMVEAMAFGKPVVSTSQGAAGLLQASPQAFRLADSDVAFAKQVTAILLDQQLRESLAENARKFAVKYNDTQITELSTLFKRLNGEAV